MGRVGGLLDLDEANSSREESVLVAKGFGSDGGQPFAKLEGPAVMFPACSSLSLTCCLLSLLSTTCDSVLDLQIYLQYN